MRISRPFGRLSAGFALAAVTCLVVAFVQRHTLDLGSFRIEGAYFSRSVGAPAEAAVFSSSGGNVFDPFAPLSAYLWLGMGIGLAIAALAVLLVGRIDARTL
jgi:hypothetical protein